MPYPCPSTSPDCCTTVRPRSQLGGNLQLVRPSIHLIIQCHDRMFGRVAPIFEIFLAVNGGQLAQVQDLMARLNARPSITSIDVKVPGMQTYRTSRADLDGINDVRARVELLVRELGCECVSYYNWVQFTTDLG